MRNLRIGCLIGFFLFLPATLAAQKVTVDYDHSVTFTQYKTFMWLRQPHIADPLMRKRVVDAINGQLIAKGLQEVTAGADLGVIANGATREEDTLETFYTGFGGWRWGGWGTAITTPETYTIGTLVVDLFDIKNKQVIWRGKATESLSEKPEKDAQKINKAVEKMFKEFPPKGA